MRDQRTGELAGCSSRIPADREVFVGGDREPASGVHARGDRRFLSSGMEAPRIECQRELDGPAIKLRCHGVFKPGKHRVTYLAGAVTIGTVDVPVQ